MTHYLKLGLIALAGLTVGVMVKTVVAVHTVAAEPASANS